MMMTMSHGGERQTRETLRKRDMGGRDSRDRVRDR